MTGTTDGAVALMGNPNVGKSTVFNALTGLRQHTGNWPGKTVATARGSYETPAGRRELDDLPGTYSLLAHSPEEEVARDALCFGGARAAVVVCDAGCLERNLTLALQVLEVQPRTLVCVNLMDEAERRGIRVDLEKLSRLLGAPVVGTSAGRGEGLEELKAAVDALLEGPAPDRREVKLDGSVELAVRPLAAVIGRRLGGERPCRWLALRLLEGEPLLEEAILAHTGWNCRKDEEWRQALLTARDRLKEWGLDGEALKERLSAETVRRGEEIAQMCVRVERAEPDRRDRALDRIFTRRATGVPVMLLMLAAVFWLTIVGANGPSEWLSGLFAAGQERLTALFRDQGWPEWLHGALVLGVYRTLGWVVSVMLPPMAIFFPMFTLLEDFGYLPRVAFVLDHAFQKAGTCGKQALTMWLRDLERAVPMWELERVIIQRNMRPIRRRIEIYCAK